MNQEFCRNTITRFADEEPDDSGSDNPGRGIVSTTGRTNTVGDEDCDWEWERLEGVSSFLDNIFDGSLGEENIRLE